MMQTSIEKPLDILLVEDNLGDVRLTMEALKSASIKTNLHTVRDGAAALAFLGREGTYADAPRPHIVLLDLNLPKMSGPQVLEQMKADQSLKSIPVIILTTSENPSDVAVSYELYANCYVSKPLEISVFRDVVRKIDEFWFSIARLPEV